MINFLYFSEQWNFMNLIDNFILTISQKKKNEEFYLGLNLIRFLNYT